MADHDEPERVWDEYDWERFLQQQDRKTERYMELLETYIDDPDRDQIIAREMGWHHLADAEGQDWVESVDSLFEDQLEEDEFDEDDEEFEDEEGEEGEAEEEEEECETFELHPLYRASFALTVWIDQLFEEAAEARNHPAAVKLATQTAIASAKLAAALSDDDLDEIGMTIAYLKRALKAITTAMDAANQLELKKTQSAVLINRLFQIRDGIILMMGEYRAEWRRRFGAN